MGALRQAVRVLVICHTRELAYQIKHEFERFAKFFAEVAAGKKYTEVQIVFVFA